MSKYEFKHKDRFPGAQFTALEAIPVEDLLFLHIPGKGIVPLLKKDYVEISDKPLVVTPPPVPNCPHLDVVTDDHDANIWKCRSCGVVLKEGEI